MVSDRSLIPSPPSSGSGLHKLSTEGPLARTSTTRTGVGLESKSGESRRDSSLHEKDVSALAAIDFVGSSSAVKKLFSIPFIPSDEVVSVAIHNVEGILVLDEGQPTTQEFLSRNISSLSNECESKEDNNNTPLPCSSCPSEVSQALVTLSSLAASSSNGNPTTSTTSNNQIRNDSLAVVNTFLSSKTKTSFGSPLQHNQDDEKTTLGLPRPDHYVHQHIPPAPEPKEYLSWKFHDMNLWVGSDALILRERDDKNNKTVAFTVRVEDAQQMRALINRHQHDVKTAALQHGPKKTMFQHRKQSYASVLLKTIQQPTREPNKRVSQNHENHNKNTSDETETDDHLPDEQLRLQTCIVPCPAMPVGGLLDTATASKTIGVANLPTQNHGTGERATMVSPVSTVLDAYLDNIMANVPQLALCLREKGFIQSVKLLETETIPSAFLHPSTMDTSKLFHITNEESEQVFSPQVMEMNATALLRFLKLNCSRDNATYLMTRERGQTNVHLYDISSISATKQKKWIWWLAMMSCRFAQRLKNISIHSPDPSLRRSFRNRERGLLQNALDLLEVLTDMDGTTHDSLAAGIRENLADTFLRGEDDSGTGVASRDIKSTTNIETTVPSPEPATSQSSSQQPYAFLTVDALNKAHDILSQAIKCLLPLFQKKIDIEQNERSSGNDGSTLNVVSIDGSSSEESDEEVRGNGNSSNNDLEVIATATQLFALHQKIVNVSLRLAEIHLRHYYSSSAMQALRSAARRIAFSLDILQALAKVDDNKGRDTKWLRHLQLQYVWLWEHCGHFARSFAGDELWRDRGHASADDILTVLQDSESCFVGSDLLWNRRESSRLNLGLFFNPCPISTKTGNSVNLHSLSGIVDLKRSDQKRFEGQLDSFTAGIEEARDILDRQKFLQREQRKVFLAACLAYNRAIHAFKHLEPTSQSTEAGDTIFLALLQQRLGDACNEAGKILMNELRSLLSNQKDDSSRSDEAALALLSSAEFWFTEGLDAFDQSGDLRNLVLLRCNLCQCYKLRANALFARKNSSTHSDHAESCLQEAANQLEAAHEALGERGSDPKLWDMVSEELAATFLVLGVRRRQSFIGSGNTPVVLESLRLTPGQERSIVEPMNRALTIYESSGNMHQAAAVHYQLALFFSKVWTCQRDETKTREKLAAAFKHYNAAHCYFNQVFQGNELTLCLVCLDLSNLYSSVQGEEGNAKALLCCLDTIKVFDGLIREEATEIPRTEDWYRQMDTVTSSVEDRVFKLLRKLVKLMEDGETNIPYKNIYRVSLTAKMMLPKPCATGGREYYLERLSAVRQILIATDHEIVKLGLK